MDEKYLCFINHVGTDINGEEIYELLFTDNVDTFWGENFEFQPCCLCNGLTPNETDYDKSYTRKFKTKIKLTIIQDSCCHSFQDCIDGITPLAYQSLEGLDEYPKDGRLVLPFGITYENTEELLSEKNILFES